MIYFLPSPHGGHHGEHCLLDDNGAMSTKTAPLSPGWVTTFSNEPLFFSSLSP